DEQFNDLILASPAINGGSCGAEFTADGKQFGVLRRSGEFLLFDVATGKAIETGLPENLGKKQGFVQAALDPNGKQLATFSRFSPKEGVTLWDLSSGKVLHTIRFPDPPEARIGGVTGMVYSPAGNRLLLTSAKEAVLWNTASGEKEAAFPFPEGFTARNFS